MPYRLCPPLGENRKWFHSLGVENRATDKDQGRCKLVFFFRVSGSGSRTGSSSPGMKNLLNLFELLVLVLRNSKILLCISLEEQLGGCPKAALLFLDCSSLVSASPLFPY